MAHAVIEFQHSRTQGYQTVLRSPSGVEGVGVPYHWAIPQLTTFADLAEEVKDGVTLRAGDELLASLLTNPSIQRYVSSIVSGQNPCGIYFEAQPGAEAADELPWEALREAGHFLALERWPIGRMQTFGSTNFPKVDYDFFTPLKMMAVLSAPAAAGSVSAGSEWAALLATLTKAQRELRESWNIAGDAIKLLVCVSEENLLRQIETLAKGCSWISVTGISDQRQLLDAKAEFVPHIVHLFGHGGTETDPIIRLGSRRDWELEKDGSIQISPADLCDSKDILWLVTLNCCSGAANVGGANGFAKMAVRGGIPAAIGMREPINSHTAQLLSRNFYDCVFDGLKGVQLGGQPVEPDWAGALTSVRASLHTSCEQLTRQERLRAENCKHWTLPVLYRRSSGFRIRRQAQRTLDGVALVTKRATFQQQRSILVSWNDLGMYTEMIAKIDIEIAEIDRKLQE